MKKAAAIDAPAAAASSKHANDLEVPAQEPMDIDLESAVGAGAAAVAPANDVPVVSE